MTNGIPPDQADGSQARSIGRYRVLDEVGRGAMGVVYRGFDPVIGRLVALKTLHVGPGHSPAPEYRERLYREAAAAGALSHPNIVTIFDIVEDGPVTAVAMELVEGRSLAEIIAAHAPLPVDAAADILEQVCSALDFAGSQGIVHRDIKPANILLTPAGRVKVTDFGVARLALSTMTQAGTVLGSPSYMSPEQVRGRALDPRSDLFSAAIVFFEMITRERPFAGDDVATTMYRIAHEAPAPPNRFNAAIGAEVTAILDRAFAKDPAERFQSGADFVAGIRSAAGLGSGRHVPEALASLAAAAMPPVPPVVTLPAGAAGSGAVSAGGRTPAVLPIPAGGAPTPAVIDGDGHTLAPIPVPGGSRTPSALADLEGRPTLIATQPPPAVRHQFPRVPPALTPAAKPDRRRGLARIRGTAIAALIAGAAAIAAGTAWWRGRAVVPDTGQAAGAQEAEAPGGTLAQPEERAVPDAPPPAANAPLEPGRPGPARPSSGAPIGAPPRPRGAAPAPAPVQRPAAETAPTPDVALPAAAAEPAGPPAVRAGRVYRITEVDTRPAVSVQAAPLYPEDAAKQGIEDVVVLEVLVSEAGLPLEIKVLRGSRKAPSLDAAAIAAVRRWQFSPARKSGAPVACRYNVGVPFAIPR